MEIKRGNFCFRDPGVDEVPADAVITGGNFTQLRPDTQIMRGRRLTILGGNWTNCKKDAAWEVRGGIWPEVGFCTHLSPHLIERGLRECADDCEHRSAAKVRQTVDEQEYRDAKARARDPQDALTDSDCRVSSSEVDADGVTVETFTVDAYEFKQTVNHYGTAVEVRDRG